MGDFTKWLMENIKGKELSEMGFFEWFIPAVLIMVVIQWLMDDGKDKKK